jgi:hypothetical protein
MRPTVAAGALTVWKDRPRGPGPKASSRIALGRLQLRLSRPPHEEPVEPEDDSDRPGEEGQPQSHLHDQAGRADQGRALLHCRVNRSSHRPRQHVTALGDLVIEQHHHQAGSGLGSQHPGR